MLQPNHFNIAQEAEFGSMLSGRRLHPWLTAAQGPSNDGSVAFGTPELSPRRNASAAGRPGEDYSIGRSSPLGGSSHHRHGRRHRHSASQGSGSYGIAGHRRGGSHKGFQAQHASSPAHSHGQVHPFFTVRLASLLSFQGVPFLTSPVLRSLNIDLEACAML